MLKLAYKPHLGCYNFFETKVSTFNEALRIALALSLYQTFLGLNNHSQMPKARIELRRPPGTKLHRDHYALVQRLNYHSYTNMKDIDDLATCQDAMEWKMRLHWIPQVPGKAFVFPVKSKEEAALIHDILANYDSYLLDDCEDMRVDHANACFVDMIDPDWTKDDGPQERWTDWYYEIGDTYYADFDDYLSQTAKIDQVA